MKKNSFQWKKKKINFNSPPKKINMTNANIASSKSFDLHHSSESYDFKEKAGELDIRTFTTKMMTPSTADRSISNTSTPSKNGNVKVLVVDDDAFNIKAIGNMLSSLKVKYDTAFNGKQAIDLVCEKNGEYSMIFMDCQMPVMDGLTATRILKSKMQKGLLKEGPIVGITGKTMQEESNICLQAGMDKVLSKPFNLSELKSVLDYYLL